MIKIFTDYIERGSWEEDIERQFDLLDGFCVAVIIIAAIYFGPAFVQMVVQEVSR